MMNYYVLVYYISIYWENVFNLSNIIIRFTFLF